MIIMIISTKTESKEPYKIKTKILVILPIFLLRDLVCDFTHQTALGRLKHNKKNYVT